MMSKFQEYQSFIQDNNNYSLLPFRFSRLDEDQVFLSNIAGQYLVLNNKNFDLFAKKKLEKIQNFITILELIIFYMMI